MSHDPYCLNTYSDPYKGGWIFICAGGIQDASTGSWIFVKGGIWVDLNPDPRQSGPETSPPPPDSADNEYLAPNSTWAKVISVNGNIVTLQRQDGSTFRFDLTSRQYE
jgi:hypothetical protein